MVMVPWWASTRRLAVGSPSPVPRDFVVKNGVKIFSRMSGGMPGPASLKTMWHEESIACTAIRIVPRPCIAWALFMVVKGINRLQRKEAAKPATPPEPPRQEVLLQEIRDILAKKPA